MPLSTTGKAPAPIALTMGDPAGIGPLTTIQAWRARRERSLPPFVFIGALSALKAHDPDLPVEEISDFNHAAGIFDKVLPVFSFPLKATVVPGHPDRHNTGAVIHALDLAVKEAIAGNVSAIVTNPVHKASLLEAGFSHPGHTGYLGAVTGRVAVMMLVNPELRVVPVTGHIALKDVSRSLTRKHLVEVAGIVIGELKERFGIANPRIAFTGLNPHAGEGGALGQEEIKTIIPAIRELYDLGHQVAGPFPADTAFAPSMRGAYDAFLAMTHDQALIPIKTLDFRSSVNITLGLPFVRTSPAHGTAFNILKEGRSPDPESLIQALLMAARLTG
ncbi:MAG: 4-hydroxythreonine-4-phosphate dehydrogenase PdxA [Proteobacteria bacterium]|nr:4-hydroxythreonine-4-phosphate dehydrogenase PdxA [Pseudomonadota bacterium]